MTAYEKVTQKGYLMKMTLPIFVELLLQMLVGNVDQIMVGQYSPLSVGAIGNANQIVNLIILSFSVVCTASTIILSLYMGSGSQKKVEQLYTVSLFVNFLFGFFVSIVFLFFSQPILLWLKVPQDILPQTVVYLRIIGGGMVLQAIYLTFGAILRSNTMMKESMYISIAVNVLNIIGNFILINGAFSLPAQGIAGAAISSNISRVVGVIAIYIVCRKRLHLRLKKEHLHPFPWDLFRKLMSIGLPAGGESLSYNFSQIFIQKTANYFGSTVIATKAYAAMFANLSYVFAMAIGQACQIMVGYLIGARDVALTDKKVKQTLALAVLISVTVSIIVYFTSDFFFGLFTENEEIIRLGKAIMLIEILLETGRAVNIILVKALQAAGDINFPIGVSIVNVWIVAVGLGFVFSRVLQLGLCGIWLAMAMDECIRAVLFLIRWKKGRWKNRSLLD